MQNFLNNIEEKLDSKLLSFKSAFLGETANVLAQYDRSIQPKFDHMADEINAIKHSQDRQQQHVQEMQKQIDLLNKAVDIATQAVVEPKNQAYDREVVTSILRITTQDMVPKEKVLEAITPWLLEAELKYKEHFTLQGPPLGKYQILQFTGDAGLAARRANKAQSLLRDDNHQWREFSTSSPSGAMVRIYVSKDKSPKKIKEEMGAKKLFNIIKDACKNKQVHFNRKDASISIDWTPVARVEAPDPEHTNLLWNYKGVQQFDIDKDEVANLFKNACGGDTTSVQWGL
jgi:hypothetical protein